VTDMRKSSAWDALDISAPRSPETPHTSDTPDTPRTPDTLHTPDTAGRDHHGLALPPRLGGESTAGGWDWDVVSRLLEEALARPASDREAFLLDACGGDRMVLEEVASLAAAHDAANRRDDGSSGSGPLERLAAALTLTRRRRDDASGDGRGLYVDTDPDTTITSAYGPMR
jgi:hypothetical protein